MAQKKGDIWKIQHDCTLMEFLQEKFKGISRTKIREWMAVKRVCVNGSCVTRADFALQAGMEVQLLAEHTGLAGCTGLAGPVGRKTRLEQAGGISILYEDPYLLVIDKPHGLLTNSPRPSDVTAQRLLNDYLERSRQRCHSHTIHRLDRETSGLLLFAKDKKTALLFEDHWKERVFDRRYIAVVHGQPPQAEGEISSWLKDNKMFVSYSSPYDNGGKFAITHFRLLQAGKEFSLLELQLETGRKNQIRVHLQDLGCPVAGDCKYGDGSNPIGRLCLHARRLYFYHPITGKEYHFETDIPAAFRTALKVTSKNSTFYNQ